MYDFIICVICAGSLGETQISIPVIEGDDPGTTPGTSDDNYNYITTSLREADEPYMNKTGMKNSISVLDVDDEIKIVIKCGLHPQIFGKLIEPIVDDRKLFFGGLQTEEVFSVGQQIYTWNSSITNVDYMDMNKMISYRKVNNILDRYLKTNKLFLLFVDLLTPFDPSQILNFSNALLRQLTYQPTQTSLQTVDPSQILKLSTDILRQLAYKPEQGVAGGQQPPATVDPSQILNFSNALLRQLTYQPTQTSLQTVDPSQILNLSTNLLRQLTYQPTQTSLQTVDPSQILNLSTNLLRQLTYIEAKDNTLYDNISDGYNRFMASMEEPNTFTVRTTRPGENGDKIETCYNPDGEDVDCPQ